MLRLFKAELFKLFKNRTFKVLCIVAILLGVMSIGMIKIMSSEEIVKSSLAGMTEVQKEKYIDNLKHSMVEQYKSDKVAINLGMQLKSKDMFNPTIKEIFYSSFGSGFIEILLAVLIGAIVAKEYTSGTIKNTLAYGNKRDSYYISKILAATIGLIIILAILVGITTIGSSFFFSWGQTFNISQVVLILKVFLLAIVVGVAIISLITLLATLLKSNGATIGIGICLFAILPMILGFLYGKFDWYDTLFELTTSYSWGIVTKITSTNSDLLRAFISSIVIAIIGSTAGVIAFRKQDIK